MVNFHNELYCMLIFENIFAPLTPEWIHKILVMDYFIALDHTKPPLLYHSHVQTELKTN